MSTELYEGFVAVLTLMTSQGILPAAKDTSLKSKYRLEWGVAFQNKILQHGDISNLWTKTQHTNLSSC